MATYISDNKFHTISVHDINGSIESLRSDAPWFIDFDVNMDDGVTYDTIRNVNDYGATVLVDGDSEQSLELHQFQLFLSINGQYGQCLLYNDHRRWDYPMGTKTKEPFISPIRNFSIHLYYDGDVLYVEADGYDSNGNVLRVDGVDDVTFQFPNSITSNITHLSYQLPEGINISNLVINPEYTDNVNSSDQNSTTEKPTSSSTIDPINTAPPIADKLPFHINDARPIFDYYNTDYIPDKFLTGSTINKRTECNYNETIWRNLDNTMAVGLINSWNISGHAGKIYACVPLKDLLVRYNGKVVKLSEIKDPGVVKYAKGDGWTYTKLTTSQYVEKNSMQVCGGVHQSTLDYRRSVATTIDEFNQMYKPKNMFGKNSDGTWTRKVGSNLTNFEYIAGQVHRGTSYDIYKLSSDKLSYVDTVERLNTIFKNN